ncbi:MAG: PrsW family intramembrane metalloprotease [Eubacteriaceae bacterium]|nr:PrsW family intramembrane metalloprotease [Eubacteriaceae bacterium]
MAILIGSLLISMIPSLLIYFWFSRMYKGDKDHTKTCRKLFGKGVLCVFGVLGLDLIFSILWNKTGLSGKYEIIDNLFRCFIINAFVEELVKLLNARSVIKKRMDSVSWLSMTMYTSIVAIGFGLAEDVVYAFSTSPGQILIRGITAGHVAYALITGYFLGKGYKYGEKKYKVIGTVLPWLLHGLYNFGLSENTALGEDLAAVFGILSVLIAVGGAIFIIVMLLKIKKWKDDPVYTEPFPLSQKGEKA